MIRMYRMPLDSESRATILTATWFFLFDQLRSSMPYFALDDDERADMLRIRQAAFEGEEGITLEAVQWMALEIQLDRWMMLDDRLSADTLDYANALSERIHEMLDDEPDMEVPWPQRIEVIAVSSITAPRQKTLEFT